jgi:hypothetical protein
MRALRKLGEEEDEDLSSWEAEADSDAEPADVRTGSRLFKAGNLGTMPAHMSLMY